MGIITLRYKEIQIWIRDTRNIENIRMRIRMQIRKSDKNPLTSHNTRLFVSILVVVMSTTSERKDKRFDLVCLLSERKQNILIWYIKNCIASRSFLFWPKNSGTKQSNLIWSGNFLRQSRTFLFNPKTYRWKQKVLIWFAYYRNKSKTF